MALDFPTGVPNGFVYTDPNTGTQWVYDATTNSWTSKGLVNSDGGIIYKGSLDITAAPPVATSGDMYSVEETGTANAGFTGIAGTTINSGSFIVYDGSQWVVVDVSSYWTRVDNHLEPNVSGVDVEIGGGNIDLQSSGEAYFAGNVGIGTTNPSYELQVSDGSSTTISIEATADNTSARAGRLVYSFDDGDGASINAVRATGNSVSDVNLSFRTGGITNSEEKMRITSSGNVGIGTTNPTRLLDVAGNNNPVILLNNSSTDSSSSRSTRFILNIGNAFAGGIRASTTAGSGASAASLQFGAGGDTAYSQMRILANGNVGIGVTAPDDKLEIGGNGAGIILASPNGTRYRITVADDGTLTSTAV